MTLLESLICVSNAVVPSSLKKFFSADSRVPLPATAAAESMSFMPASPTTDVAAATPSSAASVTVSAVARLLRKLCSKFP